MAKRIGVFCDVSNLYYCIQKKYPKRKLDYRKYMRFVQDLGEVLQAICYGAQMSKQADGFKYCLQQMGYQTKYKVPKVYGNERDGIKRKADWDVGIAMDIVQMIDRFDMIILGSGDGDMVPVVDWCRQKGVDVVILGTGISRDLRKAATKAIEIPESLLESAKPKGAVRPREMVNKKIQAGTPQESLRTVSDNRKDDASGTRVDGSEGVSSGVVQLREDEVGDVPSCSSRPGDDSESVVGADVVGSSELPPDPLSTVRGV